jgi:hypothetical protein
MTERLILKSKTSIVYVATIIVFLFFTLIALSIISHYQFERKLFAQVFIIAVYFFYMVDVILSLRTIRFYESHLIIRYLVRKKSIVINYIDFENLVYDPRSKYNRAVFGSKNSNRQIKLKTENYNLYISEMQFENFAQMRVLLFEVIRGEFNPDEWY